MLLRVEMCRPCGHRGKSSWSSPRNARGGRESQETRHLQTLAISAERVVPGTCVTLPGGRGGGKRHSPVQRLEVGKYFRGGPYRPETDLAIWPTGTQACMWGG